VAGVDDTIAAIATAAGRGGVGIVRVSGPRAAAVLAALLRPAPASLESHRVYHGHVHDPQSGAPVDEVLAFLLRGPHSYTGEDVVELQGHGGAVSLEAVLEAALRAGARPAGTGEFTRRAFLAGRLDLAQAEAVADVVAARSARALRQAQAQLRGALGARVRELRQQAVGLLAEVEAGLDFPDEELEVATRASLVADAQALATAARALGDTYRAGRALREGLEVVLRGRANVGKSSLLNALAGEERVLVDAAPHTTRDVVEVALEWDAVGVTLVDTAGVGDAMDAVQARGVALGAQRAAQADVALVVLEAGTAPATAERALWEAIDTAKVLVLAKADRVEEAVSAPAWGAAAVVTSATTGRGLDELRRAVLRAGGIGEPSGEAEEGAVASTARQRDLLYGAAAAAGAAATAIAAARPVELAAVDLRAALEALGAVVGLGLGDDVLDAVFSRFCVGK
jgi:tRNA modification GTPase